MIQHQHDVKQEQLGKHTENKRDQDTCCSQDLDHQRNNTCCDADALSHSEELTVDAAPNYDIRAYTIEGMDCGSCAATLERHFKLHPSVKHVRVNFSSAKMYIEHDNTVDEIIHEVSKAGYKATFTTSPTIARAEQPKAFQHQRLVLSGILILLGFAGSFTAVSNTLITMLYGVAILICGYKPAKSAFYAIKSRSLDMNVLMTIAVIGAAAIGEWFEGATVVWLFALGNALQTSSIDKTRQSIRNLLNLAPTEAWVTSQQGLVKKPVEEINIGDTMIIKPGDKVPLDGIVTSGESSINQAPITGESIPVDKVKGDTVYAGTLNEHGSLEVQVTKRFEDTALSNIIHLVEEAQEKKAPTQAFVDRFAQIYTPIVFVAALLIMLAPPLLDMGTWESWFYKGLELLVVACPCALVISTPVAIVSAIGNAARNGVLIKGGTFLEAAGALNAIAFDKTGTLTEGKPEVTDVISIGMDKNELLTIAYTLEQHSNHPIAKSIVTYANELAITPVNGMDFRSIVGKGVQATLQDAVYYAGKPELFHDLNIPISQLNDQIQALQQEGHTIVLIGKQTQVLGLIAVADTIRDTSMRAIKNLKQLGIHETIMLTGDNEGTARKIAMQAGVDQYQSELMPDDKVNAIRQLQGEGKKVAMVGDGVNDAPALATANIGIAMGGAGTDTAMETADIVLMADHLEKLPFTMKLSRKALSVIKQNITFSLIVKLAALVLIFPDILTLWIAVLSDTGAALIVVLNSMRLLKLKS